MFEITRERTFSASHQIRGYNGKCERLHGHNWRVRVTVASTTLNNTGMVMDFHELDELMRSAVAPFEHRHLNDVSAFRARNPTSENVARAVGEAIAKALAGRPIRLRHCDVFETDLSRARYRFGPFSSNRDGHEAFPDIAVTNEAYSASSK
jgi:6-pyruvoyltetrahydropterin/6-carboxytetrahydropterin synthase